MTPFDYVLTLISFIFALALTHLLMGAARMVRHRSQLTFSWPHALWMAVVFADLVINWLGFWDAHLLKVIDLATVAVVVAMSTAQYLVAALVTPEFESAKDFDLVRFQEEQGRTYLTALVVFGVIGLAVNGAGSLEGIGWAQQNGIVLAMFVPTLAALFIRRPAVQILAPLAEMALLVWFALAFYPRIA
jgi:hypothetical protein